MKLVTTGVKPRLPELGIFQGSWEGPGPGPCDSPRGRTCGREGTGVPESAGFQGVRGLLFVIW